MEGALMITVYSEEHRLHEGRQEFHRGKMHPCFERPERAELIIQRLRQENWEVVPPNQSEMIVDALRTRKVPVAYLLFDGEQHGFRRAENIRRALDAELSFYAQVFGFELPPEEGIEPVTVENAENL